MPIITNRKQKTFIGLFISFLIVVFLECFIGYLSKNGMAAYNGVVFASQVAMCLLMIRINCHYGRYLANAILFTDFLYLLVQYLILRKQFLLPGIANCLVFVVSVFKLGQVIERKQKESLTDELTGLLNTRGLRQYIRDIMDSKSKFFVISIELRDFSLIHGNYGHEIVDKMIIRLGNILSEEIGKNGRVARINAAEFVIVVSGSDFSRERIFERIQMWNDRKINLISDIDPSDCFQKFNAGIVESEGSMSVDDILSASEIAKYNAGKKPGIHYEFFNSSMKESIEKGIEIERIIHKGLDGNWFYMMYQPQYTLKEKKLRGFESLIRMKTPEGKFVSPGDFIPVAEKTELIMLIDEYVLNQVMTDLHDYVLENEDVVISINVSAKNICKKDFADRVIKLLKKHDFPAKNIEIEITEYVFMNSLDITLSNIEKLHEAGIQIALDDFGTGYSSLSYLTKIPVDLLKIDKSLVDEIESDRRSLEFVKSVVTIGHGLGCEVICEGVEQTNQLELLKTADVDFIQGYVWGKPLSLEDAKKI